MVAVHTLKVRNVSGQHVRSLERIGHQRSLGLDIGRGQGARRPIVRQLDRAHDQVNRVSSVNSRIQTLQNEKYGPFLSNRWGVD